MQKEDIQWAVLGILLLLVIALVIKPMMTGEPVNIGLPETPTPTPESSPDNPLQTITLTPILTVTVPTPTPTPLTTWDQSTTTLVFVDPSTYGVNLDESLPNATNIPESDAAVRNSSMATYATFAGQFSGATQVIRIPFPYWELWYTVEPLSADLSQQAEVSGRYAVTPTEGVYKSGFTGSYSTALPKFSIEVIDADDPNRIVRAITPPGNIDPSLWSGEDDPRPWIEKFYEGNRGYYFIIRSSILKSYAIDIKIPSSYVGKY